MHQASQCLHLQGAKKLIPTVLSKNTYAQPWVASNLKITKMQRENHKRFIVMLNRKAQDLLKTAWDRAATMRSMQVSLFWPPQQLSL